MMNSFKAHGKFSNLEKTLGEIIVYLFLFMLGICFIFASWHHIWASKNKNHIEYLNLKFGDN